MKEHQIVALLRAADELQSYRDYDLASEVRAIAAQLAAPASEPAEQGELDAEAESFAAWWASEDRDATMHYWAQQAWLKRAQLAAPIPARAERPADQFLAENRSDW